MSDRPFNDIPEPLAEARLEELSARHRAEGALGRQRLRRRVVPPLVVGSAAILGSGMGAAWVDGTLSHSPAGVRSGTSTVSAAQLAAQVAHERAVEAVALARVQRAIREDSAVVASLAAGARSALAASLRTRVVDEVGSGGGGQGSAGAAPAGASPTAAVPGVSIPSGGLAGSAGPSAIPSLPPLPPMPSFTVPTTHGTTGATPVP